ncbi:hypothetical protein B551_0208695 [Cupriavidus sp. HPC(L)]|uniref:hypothetical protein n=1 Tax=Cupriavidus sp. HPC(L) TaxID=1217418 RepID=UPI0003BE8C2C|nr:hypothetical protein [Cupriavidus sp. HPC(L)]ESJ21478.1 hypothetical protein B551_0208695 [Cupriavidus sp. HPC(L)]
MIAKHLAPILVACGLAFVSALGSGLANATESGKHLAKGARQGYNIDKARDFFTEGARYIVQPGNRAGFARTGQDLTGVSAPPGQTRV